MTTTTGTTAAPQPLGYSMFLRGMAQLTVNYPPRAPGEANADALLAAWWRVLDGKPWITDALFDRAVVLTLADQREFLPAVGEFVAICEYARDVARHEAEREAAKLLPPPAARVVADEELDEQDEYACTAAERERWAREDVWCRGYARTLDPNPPPNATEAELDSWRRNWSVANWPKLTPRQRRAKERRIAGERGGAMAYLAEKFGRDPVRLLESIPAGPRAGEQRGAADRDRWRGEPAGGGHDDTHARSASTHGRV